MSQEGFLEEVAFPWSGKWVVNLVPGEGAEASSGVPALTSTGPGVLPAGKGHGREPVGQQSFCKMGC